MNNHSSFSRREFLARSLGGLAATSLGPLIQSSQTAMAMPTAKPKVPLAMWALTGTLKSDDVRRQLDAYHNVGWGVVLYPRWGLELEYLGDAWFERIRFIVEEAAARKMEVWLYDEFCWPRAWSRRITRSWKRRYCSWRRTARAASSGFPAAPIC